jgi:hypothetical protein
VFFVAIMGCMLGFFLVKLNVLRVCSVMKGDSDT